VTYTAWSFVLTSLQSGRQLAFGLICPDARFVGRLLCARGVGEMAVEHGQLTPAAWQDLLHELSLGVSPAPVARTSAIHQALAGAADGLTIQYVSHQLIALAQPHEVTAGLDRFLTRQVEAYDSTREA
jgi:hypothetical protein